MQRSHRNHFNAGRFSAIVPRKSTQPDAGLQGARVTMLGDYFNRHGRAEPEATRPSPGKAGFGVGAIGRDPGASPLAPRQNHLLAALKADDYARLLPCLELAPLRRGEVVCEARSRPDYVYFPTSGIVSMIYELANGTSVEVAGTGNDGMVGVAVFMGGETTTSRAVVRNTGYAYRLPAGVLKREFDSQPALRQLLLRYAQTLLTEMAQTAVCHGHHSLEQQLSRLLLVSIDRLPSNDVALTQDAIANLLGARRESITAAAGKLQAAGLIRYHRGRINVADRAGLESAVCECYAAAKAEVDRLVPRTAHIAHPTAVVARGDSGGGLAASARARAVRLQPDRRQQPRAQGLSGGS